LSKVLQEVKVAKKRGKKDPKVSIGETLGGGIEDSTQPGLSAAIKRKKGGKKGKSEEKKAKLMSAMQTFMKTILEETRKERMRTKRLRRMKAKRRTKRGTEEKKETRAATLLELKRGEKDLLKRANKEEDDVKKLLCAGSEVEESSGSWRQFVTKSTVSEVLVRLDSAHREEGLI
jgi:hypothetical protein